MSERDAGAPVITFLSDYGLIDEYVGVCHGVIARRCPQARVIDLTHAIPRHDVRTAAIVLGSALPFLPVGVHLAVVDPGVGAAGRDARRALALRTVREERLLVGPDNGVLMIAAERLGGVAEAVDVGRSPARLEPVSRTFHGRDVFAPVAAALAAGEPLGEHGEQLDPEGLRRLGLPAAEVRDGVLTAHVLRSDSFGNLTLDAPPAQLAAIGAKVGDTLALGDGRAEHAARYCATFADVAPHELLIYEDSARMIALAVNRGSAARLLGLGIDDELTVRRL